MGIDMLPDANGMVGPEPLPLPCGASLFADPLRAPLRGNYHRLPRDIKLPAGIEVTADGIDFINHSPHPAGHYTLYPTAPMPSAVFVDAFLKLPWQFAGRKK
jgi:hypothetical protein